MTVAAATLKMTSSTVDTEAICYIIIKQIINIISDNEREMEEDETYIRIRSSLRHILLTPIPTSTPFTAEPTNWE
jgi:hypothetical protein